MDEQYSTEPGTVRIDDARRGAASAPRPGEGGAAPSGPADPAGPRAVFGEEAARGPAAVYLEAQRGEVFQRMRRGHRRFIRSACLLFLTWYLLYIAVATGAPGLLRHRVFGAFNVALLAALAQFVSTFLLCWAYARNARVHRDRAALDLRWEIQERIR